METLDFLMQNYDKVLALTLEHLMLVSIAVGLAIITGVPLGIAITQNQRAADIVLYVASVIITIPSIALFGLMIPILSMIGQGIGYLPAIIAVLLYSQLPIIRNTYTAINNVNPSPTRSCPRHRYEPRMPASEVWWKFPLSIPVIMAGVRTAVVMNIGVMAIASLYRCRRPGHMLIQPRYFPESDPRQLIIGAVAVSLLAIVADYALLWLQRKFTPKGMSIQ